MPTERHASPGGTAKADSRAREGEAMDDFPEFRGTAIPGCAPLPPTWKPLECSSPRPTHIRRYNALQTASPPAVKRLPAIAEQSRCPRKWKTRRCPCCDPRLGRQTPIPRCEVDFPANAGQPERNGGGLMCAGGGLPMTECWPAFV